MPLFAKTMQGDVWGEAGLMVLRVNKCFSPPSHTHPASTLVPRQRGKSVHISLFFPRLLYALLGDRQMIRSRMDLESNCECME
jgi:hypothetical protein